MSSSSSGNRNNDTKRNIICRNPSCEKPGIHRCSRCQVAFYCGRECQVQHYKGGHKEECIMLQTKKINKAEKKGEQNTLDQMEVR